MSVSAQAVKQLRERTGAGMMDCKKALSEADGDFDAAIEYLRKKGQKVSEKRADRSANEGIIVTRIDDSGTTGVALEMNCETDFVAKNDEFADNANNFADIAVQQRIADQEQLKQQQIDGITVSERLKELVGKIGEKIDINRLTLLQTDGEVISYVHPGNQLAVLVEFDGKLEDKEVGRDVAMQIAAMSPIAVRREEVSQDKIEQEREIAKQQLIDEGKPEEIAEKAAEGKMRRFYEERVLLEQKFVKDGSISVSEYLKNQGAPDVKSFKRLQLGEN